MDKLHENIAVYTHSGSAPCVQAAKGERLIGIGFDMRGASEKTKGAPIDLIVPSEGIGWDMEATAIVKGTKNLAAAKKLADFARRKDANELYGKYYALVAHPGREGRAAELSGRCAKPRWSRTTSAGWPRTASASWRSGRSATTSKAQPKK